MEIKRFNIIVCFLAFISAILAIVMYFLEKISVIYYAAYMPVEAVAYLLRWLSFSSEAGNIAAWILYTVICLSPAAFALRKKFLKRWNISFHQEQKGEDSPIQLTDVILIALSVYLLFMVYCFINPGTLSKLMTQIQGPDLIDVLPVLKSILVAVAYSLIIGFAVLKVAGGIENKNVWKQTERIIIICTMVYVVMFCFTVPLNLMQKSGNLSSDLGMTIIFIKSILKLLPALCFVGIMQSGVMLIHCLKENKYGQEAVEIAGLLAERSRKTVIVSVTCNIIQNVIQLIFWGDILHADILVDIPFLPLILAFAGLLIAEYLKESTLIYDDNQMII